MTLKIQIALYYGGETVNTNNGVDYSLAPAKMMRVSDDIVYRDFLERVKSRLELDVDVRAIDLACRYPFQANMGVHVYRLFTISDDEDLEAALEVPTCRPTLTAVEIYVTVRDVPPPGENLLSTTVDKNTVVGSTCNVVGSSSSHTYVEDQANTEDGENFDDDDDEDFEETDGDDEDVEDYLEGLENKEDEEEVLGPTTPHFDKNVAFLEDYGPPEGMIIRGREGIIHRLWKESKPDELKEKMLFNSKEGVQHAVQLWSAKHHRSFKVDSSSQEYWCVKCVNWKTQNCQWRLRASKREGHKYWEIGIFHDRHSCTNVSITADHRNVNSKMVGRMIREHVSQNVDFGTQDVRESIKGSLIVDINYKKALRGKKAAMKMVYGDWLESFRDLPRYMVAKEASNDGTIVRWRHDPELSTPDQKVFGAVFWAFRPSTAGFKHCRPMISIDGTHLYGKHNEKLLIAVAVDADDHIFPLAYAIVDEESEHNWGWLLRNIREHILGDMIDICLISDRSTSLQAAIRSDPTCQPPYAYHRYCLLHIKANFAGKFPGKALSNLLWSAATEHKPFKFTQWMEKLKGANEGAYDYLMRIPLDTWTLSHDGGRRYFVMTTNFSESWNSVLKGARFLPVTACVEAVFKRMVKMFEDRRKTVMAHMAAGDIWPSKVQERFIQSENNSGRHKVAAYDSRVGLYQVVTREGSDQGGIPHTVNVLAKTYTCGKFQLFHMPCSHAIQLCKFSHIQAADMVASFYSCRAMLDAYNASFHPVEHSAYWSTSPFLLEANPISRKRGRGRPQSSRIHREMDRRNYNQNCGICKQPGHSRNKCPSAQRLRNNV